MFPLLPKLPTPAAFTLALLLFHLLFTVLGLGATLILIPARLSRYVLIFAPLIGLCVVSWLGWQSLWLGFAGTNASAAIISIIACSLLLVPLFRMKSRVAIPDSFNREMLIALGIALCGAVALSIPAIVEPHLTTVSAGNNDVASYALTERFLMLHSIREHPGNIGEYLDVARHLTSTVFGVFFSTAMAGSLLGLETYQLQNVSVSAFVLWGGLVLYVLARELFKFRAISSLILLAGFSFSELVIYLALHGFKAQLAAMALAGSIYCWMVPMLGRDCAPTAHELVGAMLLTWGLAAAYPHMPPFVFVPLALYSVALAFEAKSVRRLRWPALSAAAVLAGAAALSPFMAQNMYRYAVLMKDVTAGWFLPWVSPTALLGVTGTSAFSHFRWPLETLLALLAAAVILAGLVVTRRRERDVFLVAVSFVAVIGGAYGYLVISGRNESGLGGYKSFKLLTFFAPVLWCSALLVLREPHPRPLVRWSQGVLAVALVAGNLIAGGRLIKSVTANHASVSRPLAGLLKLEADPRITSINIVTPSFWESMWESTFLFHKPLYHRLTTYYPAQPLRGEWTLEDGFDGILKLEPCQRGQDIRVNERFFVSPNGIPGVSASWDRGWHDSERTHRWTAEQVASIRIRSRSRGRITITMAYSPLNDHNQIAARLNGERLADCSRLHRCQMDARLEEGDNLLDLVSTLAPERPDNGDSRRLGISVSEIAIVETGCGISSR
jgi:lipoprotein signal peptidase